MTFYPHDYGMKRMDDERRRLMICEKECFEADCAFFKRLFCRVIGGLGRLLVRISEYLENGSHQPKPPMGASPFNG